MKSKRNLFQFIFTLLLSVVVILAPFNTVTAVIADKDPSLSGEDLTTRVKEAIDLASDFMINKGVTSEWEAIGLAQAGKEIPSSYYEVFLQNVENQVTGGLESGRIKITDIERLAMAAIVIGEDPQDVLDHNLIELIYNSPDHRSGSDTMTFQGNNGVIFALIALDTLDFSVPHDARWTREALIEQLLNNQNEDGSWHLSTLFESPSVDITAMALIALSKYKDRPEVAEALQKTVEHLIEVQDDNGGFSDGPFAGSVSSETTSQVVIGLTAFGIDPVGEQFTKEQNVIEHLLTYQMEDGGFGHIPGDSRSNAMATEQVFQALVAYQYFVEEKGSLYDFTNKQYPPLDPDKAKSDPIDDEEDNDENSDEKSNDDTDGNGDDKSEESNEEDSSEEEAKDNDREEEVGDEESKEGDQDESEPSKEDIDEELNDDELSEDEQKQEDRGKELPKTATNMYNILLLGLLLTVVGVLLFILNRRKSMI